MNTLDRPLHHKRPLDHDELMHKIDLWITTHRQNQDWRKITQCMKKQINCINNKTYDSTLKSN